MVVNPFPQASPPEVAHVTAVADELPLTGDDDERDTAVVGAACYAASYMQDPAWAARLFVSALDKAGMKRAVEYMKARVLHSGRGDASLYDAHVAIFGASSADIPLSWSSAAGERARQAHLAAQRSEEQRRRKREQKRKERQGKSKKGRVSRDDADD